jgi:hypothetical protein
MITIEIINAFLRQLDAEATCNPSGDEWLFANGESLFQCTASARLVAEKFGGRLFGFYSDDNPTAEIADFEDGHDFALIADRFVVDYWASYATGMTDRAVYDLLDADDQATVLRLYGPKHAWKPLSEKNARSR